VYPLPSFLYYFTNGIPVFFLFTIVILRMPAQEENVAEKTGVIQLIHDDSPDPVHAQFLLFSSAPAEGIGEAGGTTSVD